MDFLTGKQIYHGDLAARNILLTESLDAKISDFGLSRRIYNEMTTPLPLVANPEAASLRMPMKWLALEVLMHQEFIPIKSDVWSFGILTWEMFSLGKEPYRFGM